MGKPNEGRTLRLLDELHEREQNYRRCKFGRWLRDATPEDFQDLEIAFADPAIANKWIAEAVKARGLVGGKSHTEIAIAKHRRGLCPICPREGLEGLRALNVAS